MPSEGVHITLDLEIDGDYISGRADDGRGEPESFFGWLGLIAVLDRLLKPTSPRPGATDPER